MRGFNVHLFNTKTYPLVDTVFFDILALFYYFKTFCVTEQISRKEQQMTN